MSVGDTLFIIVAAIVLAPIAVLALETLAALPPRRSSESPQVPTAARAVVLIPAHNEAAGIGATIRALVPELAPQDRVVVIADNCTDGTAAAARAAGAEVVVRSDAERHGKGYALEFGVRCLEGNHPDVVIVFDADCRFGRGSCRRLKDEVIRSRSPVQARYLLAETTRDPCRQLSAFAFLFKNLVRPLGLHRLRLPCLLTGTGMAFPWHMIRDVSLATDDIVEDMKLSVELAIKGHPPRFCPDACVEGAAAPHKLAVLEQRTRWEHGHVRTLLTQGPRLVCSALCGGRLHMLALALELSVPPLSLLMLIWACALAATLTWWRLGGTLAPAGVLLASGAVLVLTLLAAWARFARGLLPLRSLLLTPWYLLWKLPIYVRLLRQPQRTWVRTERAAAAEPG
jgi:cellulose synthase/poly-beta-1,6-N-acetylglucosamine synthase-like glycosyltransferase